MDKNMMPEAIRVKFVFSFTDGIKNFWVDVRKTLQKQKRRELYLRRYWRRGERMNKR